jgi:hypothetical protein
MAAPRKGPVVRAVEKELKSLGAATVSPSLAATAVALAHEMDEDNSATSKSMCAKALIDAVDRIRELAPPKKESNPVDELRARRTARRARASAS